MKKILSTVILAIFVVAYIPFISVVEAAETSIPTVTISAPSINDVQQGGSVSFTVTFINATNIDFRASDVGIAGDGVTVVKNVSGTGNTRTVTLSNVQGPVNKIFSIAVRASVASNEHGYSVQTSKSYGVKILAGNTSVSNPVNSGNSNTQNEPDITQNVDKTRPSVVVSDPSATSVKKGGSLSYTFTYGDNRGVKDIVLNSSDVTLNGFTANISIAVSGNKRIVTLSNINGTVGAGKYISLRANTAYDLAGNTALGIAATESFSLLNDTTTEQDTTAPNISISAANPNEIYNGQTVKFIVDYTDNVGISKIDLTASKITLNGFTADIYVSGTGNQRLITLYNVQGTVGSNKTITISGGTAVDASGNIAPSASSQSFTIKATEENNNNNNGNNNNNNNNNNNGNNSNNNKPSDWVKNPNTGV